MSTSAPFAPIYLAGQTGSGKTAVALELAGRLELPVEVINADAYQIYRGLEIISAAPTEEERSSAPHHLFGILDPTEECDAARFAELAKAKIAEVGQRALPLVVGGGGLYLKAITHGIAPTPKGDPKLREKLDQKTLKDLVSEYQSLDPEGATATNLQNRRYVTRNLEICLLTGRPASELKSEWQDNEPDITAFYLERSREDIYDRIKLRTLQMFESGVIEEISNLGELSATSAKAIGIREIQSLIAGEIDVTSCTEEIQKITRRYAKRQEFWFRRETAFRRIPITPEQTTEQITDALTAHLPALPTE